MEIYKAFEQKPPDMIRAKVGDDSLSVLQSVLTNVRGINKTDVLTLSTRYHVSCQRKSRVLLADLP